MEAYAARFVSIRKTFFWLVLEEVGTSEFCCIIPGRHGTEGKVTRVSRRISICLGCHGAGILGLRRQELTLQNIHSHVTVDPALGLNAAVLAVDAVKPAGGFRSI